MENFIYGKFHICESANMLKFLDVNHSVYEIKNTNYIGL